jgi:uncharacterized protein (TIGR00369 family)
MDQGPPQAQAALARRVAEAPSGFRQLVGYRVVEWRANEATVALAVGPRHLNRSGYVHGGAITTLIDSAGGFAGCWCAVEGNARKTRTLSLTAQFLAPASGRLTARARVTGGGRKIFYTAVDVFDGDGTLVATGVGTYKYAAGSESPEGVPLPRKPDKRGTPLG